MKVLKVLKVLNVLNVFMVKNLDLVRLNNALPQKYPSFASSFEMNIRKKVMQEKEKQKKSFFLPHDINF